MTPNAATSNPPMTETIDSTNAAASTLFLGQNGEWWDFWLIASVLFAALAAIAIGVTTAGAIVSHKREAAAAEEALERYKLNTEGKISDSTARAAEANARALEAKLELEKFKLDRSLTDDQKSRIVQKLKPFAGQEYVLSVSTDQEALRFTRISLAPVFVAAGWIKRPPKGTISIPEIDAAVNVAGEPGVRIQIALTKSDDVKMRELVSIVAAAFVAEGIDAAPAGTPDMNDTPAIVQIRIGSKPR